MYLHEITSHAALSTGVKTHSGVWFRVVKFRVEEEYMCVST